MILCKEDLIKDTYQFMHVHETAKLSNKYRLRLCNIDMQVYFIFQKNVLLAQQRTRKCKNVWI